MGRCYSLRAGLEAVSAHVPEVLGGLEALRPLLQVASLVPACAHSFGFECSLEENNATVDLGVSVMVSNGGPVLAGHSGDPQLQLLARSNHRWKSIQRFALLWIDPSLGLRRRIPFVFLEFDGPAYHDPVPVPSVFAALDWPLTELTPEARARARCGKAEGSAGMDAVTTPLVALLGRPLHADELVRLGRCFDELPDGGVVLHVAAMLSRPKRNVRLSVCLQRCDTVEYLMTLGWEGSAARLDELLDTFGPYTDFGHPTELVQIDFEVEEGLGDVVGVMVQPRASSGWPRLLEALTCAGLCDHAKADALLSWPGGSLVQFDAGEQACVLMRQLAHAKIACSSAGPARVKAKAYFGVQPVWPRATAGT